MDKTGAGWLFKGGSIAPLRDSLSIILKVPSEMTTRGSSGPGFIRDHYSWPTSAERLEDIIMSLLRKN